MALLLVTLAACTTLADLNRTKDDLIDKNGWASAILSAGDFDITATWAQDRTGTTLTIYLEGDGHAYLTPTRASPDPTPIDPIALRLALSDPATGPVAYLARPCQYATPDHKRNCSRQYWTQKRYAPEIVASLDTAINMLKHKTGATNLVLAGYSGGGALAVLIAARRHDVAGIVTVAGNLDLDYWTKRDGLTPLNGSLDPADFGNRVAHIPQIHFAGAKDETVGPDVVTAYLSNLSPVATNRLIIEPDFDHFCCWVDKWPELAISPQTEIIPGWHDTSPNSVRTQ